MNKCHNFKIFPTKYSAFDPMNGLQALTGGFGQQQNPHHARGFGGGLMPFGFPPMMNNMANMTNMTNMNNMNNMNMNRLLTGDGMDGASFSSSSVISMSHGPDGKPQVYQASSSTKTGPGGLRETQRTVQDSRSGVKKMAIGHHIGERAHIIEREQNMRSGQHEERQDFINLDEEEVPEFDREFTQKSRQAMRLTNGITEVTGNTGGSRRLPAIMAADNNTR